MTQQFHALVYSHEKLLSGVCILGDMCRNIHSRSAYNIDNLKISKMPINRRVDTQTIIYSWNSVRSQTSDTSNNIDKSYRDINYFIKNFLSIYIEKSVYTISVLD